MRDIIGSVVTFNPNWILLHKTISSFLENSKNSEIIVWDNSPQDSISHQITSHFKERVTYVKSPGNYGYGKGNNAAFKLADGRCKYFCILNPDIEITPGSLSNFVAYLETHKDLELVTGSITSFENKTNPVHKIVPNFFKYAFSFATKKIFKFDPDNANNTIFLRLNEHPSRLPILSGCFLFFTSHHYKDLGGFDERFFLYFEDWDISLRSFLAGKSIILPNIQIKHAWGKQSHKSFAIFKLHLKSAFTFYKKWGFGLYRFKNINRSSGYVKD